LGDAKPFKDNLRAMRSYLLMPRSLVRTN